MRDGWTLTVEHLTCDRNEPDVYDILADAETEECYVVRQYGAIVRTRIVWESRDSAKDREHYMAELAAEGIVVDPNYDWRDFVLMADSLHAAWILAQPEVLALAV